MADSGEKGPGCPGHALGDTHEEREGHSGQGEELHTTVVPRGPAPSDGNAERKKTRSQRD